ncbi:MAG: hypothetical protein V2J02_07950 [Pseudomonadales bacterium]|jgi:hypothetical protein|nr:hypothetical protein [Pseudomonadales bacterium]
MHEEHTAAALRRALRHAQAGAWDEAHGIVQDLPGPTAAWLHAHLHREEGDLANATYWYRRAERPVCEGSLAAELARIAAALTDTAAP